MSSKPYRVRTFRGCLGAPGEGDGGGMAEIARGIALKLFTVLKCNLPE